MNDESCLFKQHMHDVQPLKKTKTVEPVQLKSLPQQPKQIHHEELSSPHQDNLDKTLNSLQKKQQPPKKKPGVTLNINPEYDLKITSETQLEWGLGSLSPAHQQKLRHGEFLIENRIDLHGLERFEAQERLKRFIEHARSHGKRNLLVIHGKGSRHGETPILKQHLYSWLKNHPYILALRSAHAKHGGSGALYVLLKKHPSQPTP